MTTKRDIKKESKILGILYWRRVCKHMLEVLRELNHIKHCMGKKALDDCQSALNTFRYNNKERKLLRRRKKREKRLEAVGV